MFKYYKNYGDKNFYPLFDEKEKRFVNFEIDVHEFAFYLKKCHYILFSGSNNIINPDLFPGLVSDLYFGLYDVQDNADDPDVPVYLIVEVYENGK